jgi:chromosome segregation ATPase
MRADLFWANVANEISKLNEQLREAHEIITDLRLKGERAVADRDRWEKLAKELKRQLELLEANAEAAVAEHANMLHDLNIKDRELKARGTEISSLKENLAQVKRQLEAAATKERKATTAHSVGKFATAKREFAKLYHPNNSRFSGIEKLVRAELFKEFWQVLERIDTEV